MFKFYLGIAICLLTIPMNHFDWYFSSFTEFSLFGNSYSFVEPFSSKDIIWTIIQKFNILIFSIGGYFIATGLSSKINTIKLRKQINLISTIVFFITGLTSIYQSVRAASMYINGFQGATAWYTMLLMVLFLTVVIGFFSYSAVLFKRSVKSSNKHEFNDKIDSLSIKFHDIISDLHDVEIIVNEMKESDNIEAWKIVTTKKARELYENADKFLKEINKVQS